MEANGVGNWAAIGYNAPGTQSGASSSYTTNFGYSDAVTGTGSGATATWTATAKVTLNDCTSGGKWALKASALHTSSTGTTYVKIEKDASSTGNCVALTPSFEKLTRTSFQ